MAQVCFAAFWSSLIDHGLHNLIYNDNIVILIVAPWLCKKGGNKRKCALLNKVDSAPA